MTILKGFIEGTPEDPSLFANALFIARSLVDASGEEIHPPVPVQSRWSIREGVQHPE